MSDDKYLQEDRYTPKSMNPEDGYFPPPWSPSKFLERTIGWLEFQRAMKIDPEYYLNQKRKASDKKMKIYPRPGYVLVSNQDIVEEKKEGKIILTNEEKKKTYLRLESDGELYSIGDCVFAQPFRTKMEIEENLFLIKEEDIVASFIL